ncbi:MAG: DMT family transporter [Candidatus Aenigmarchaeota archaeon]|nr:DMT family transporter [Candidatus Aenigmarchaeota archaeon]
MSISLGIVFGLMAMFGWGTADFLAKKVIDKIGDFKTLLWVQTFGLLALVPFYFIFTTELKYSIEDFALFILIGLMGTLGYLLFYRALRKGMVSVISPIQASWVVVTVVLSVLLLKEFLSLVESIAISITICGIILVSFRLNDVKNAKSSSILPGVPEDIISMSLWGINFVIIGFLVSQLNWFAPIFFLRVFMVIFLFSSSKGVKNNLLIPKKVIPVVAIIGLLDVMAFIGFGLGVNSVYVSIVSPIAASFPLVTIILARIFLKEKLEMNQKIGVTGILIGLILLSM